MKKCAISKYIYIYISAVVLAILLLFLISFVPQEAVLHNCIASAYLLEQEGVYPTVYAVRGLNTLDNSTEATMMMISYTNSGFDFDSILLNKYYSIGKDPIEELTNMVFFRGPGEYSSNFKNYSRYWSGYKIYMRPLLSIFTFEQIRILFGYVFFILFFFVLMVFFKWTSMAETFIFFISVLLMKPYIICVSPQYSICFLIAFASILLMPRIIRSKRFSLPEFFFLIGILTQFFDFYTTPVLTFCLPVLFLLCIRNTKGIELDNKDLITSGVLWFLGYVLMWLTKLLLTQLLTDEAAFSIAFTSLAGRISGKWENARIPWKNLFKTVFIRIGGETPTGTIILSACIILCVLIWLILCKKNQIRLCDIRSKADFAVVAVLPVIWICVAKQPTIIHQFQARTMTATVMGVLFFMYYSSSRQYKKSLYS